MLVYPDILSRYEPEPSSDVRPEPSLARFKTERLSETYEPPPERVEPEPVIAAPPQPEQFESVAERYELKTAAGKYNKPDLPPSMFRTSALSDGRIKPGFPSATRFEPEQAPSAAEEDPSALLVLTNGTYESALPAVDAGIAGCEHCQKTFTESGIYSCKRNHNICADCRHSAAPLTTFVWGFGFGSVLDRHFWSHRIWIRIFGVLGSVHGVLVWIQSFHIIKHQYIEKSRPRPESTSTYLKPWVRIRIC